MAKLQVIDPKTKEVIKPSKAFRSRQYVFQVLNLLLHGVVIYLLLTR